MHSMSLLARLSVYTALKVASARSRLMDIFHEKSRAASLLLRVFAVRLLNLGRLSVSG